MIPQHLHWAGPGGVDERPSEDVRQGRHPGGTHVSGRAQRGVRGRRRAHREKARQGLPRLPATADSTGSGLVLPRFPLAIARLLQAAPRGWLPASLMPIGFFSWELGSALLWGVVFLSSSVLVFDVLTL